MRVWKKPADVDEGSGVADQLGLMREALDHRLSGTDFARSWLAARRLSLDNSERISPTFERVLNKVFYALEDYAIDPALREDGDMSDEQLLSRIQEVLAESERL